MVLSLTYKAHPESHTTGANISFTSANISQNTFYQAITAYHKNLPTIVDAGAHSVGYLTNGFFSLTLTGYGLHASEVRALLKPFTDKLVSLGITFSTYLNEFPDWSTDFATMVGPSQVNNAQFGGWLIPRSVVVEKNEALTAAYRNIAVDGAAVITFGLKAARPSGVENSVLPAWRDTILDTVIATPWNYTAPLTDMVAIQHKITQDYVPQLKALAPHSGVYLNEADPFQPDWQTAFYGIDYQKLRRIKTRYDPFDLFYALGAVGSDDWAMDKSGRLCKA